MAKIDEKIAATAFTLPTTKTFDEVRQAGLAAISASNGAITTTTEAAAVEGQRLVYRVKRMGLKTVMTFQIDYQAEGEAEAGGTVSLQPCEYITSQAKFFLIPVGPQDAAGYAVLRDFSKKMQELL